MLEFIVVIVFVAFISIVTRFVMYNAYRYDGKMKWFFHGFLRFHRPDESYIEDDDTRGSYTQCKYCGKIIREYKNDFWD